MTGIFLVSPAAALAAMHVCWVVSCHKWASRGATFHIVHCNEDHGKIVEMPKKTCFNNDNDALEPKWLLIYIYIYICIYIYIYIYIYTSLDPVHEMHGCEHDLDRLWI